MKLYCLNFWIRTTEQPCLSKLNFVAVTQAKSFMDAQDEIAKILPEVVGCKCEMITKDIDVRKYTTNANLPIIIVDGNV
jgi:hypothetical protein